MRFAPFTTAVILTLAWFTAASQEATDIDNGALPSSENPIHFNPAYHRHDDNLRPPSGPPPAGPPSPRSPSYPLHMRHYSLNHTPLTRRDTHWIGGAQVAAARLQAQKDQLTHQLTQVQQKLGDMQRQSTTSYRSTENKGKSLWGRGQSHATSFRVTA